MKIGDQLKKFRNSLGINQSQMCKGIITESFYSKLENNKTQINVQDLLLMLNRQHISLYDFFHDFDHAVAKDEVIYQQMLVALNNRDLVKLQELGQETVKNHKLQLELKLATAALSDKLQNLSPCIKNKMKHNILTVGQWDKKSMWELSIVMKLYDFDELKLLMRSIIESKAQLDLQDQATVIAFANLLVAYLIECLKQENSAEAVKTISMIKSLPKFSAIFMQKIVADYFDAILKNELAKAENLQIILNENGYGRYLRIADD